MRFIPRIATRLKAALEGYRLVMFDQRGTGAGALRCPVLQAATGSSDLIPAPRGAVADWPFGTAILAVTISKPPTPSRPAFPGEPGGPGGPGAPAGPAPTAAAAVRPTVAGDRL